MTSIMVTILGGLIAAVVGILLSWIARPEWAWLEKYRNVALAIVMLTVAGALITHFATPGITNQPGGDTSPLSAPPSPPPPSRTETSTPPLSSGPPVPDVSPTAAPPLMPNERRYTLDFGDKTYVDLDSDLASREGGPEYEVELNFGRFFTGGGYYNHAWTGTTVVFIKDSQVSFVGCSEGTLIQGKVAFLDQVKQDETICVSTNRGAWAAMKILNAETRASGLGAGDITFAVRLFKP
jgi:hypothetical protein